jgi:hypothetical protein
MNKYQVALNELKSWATSSGRPLGMDMDYVKTQCHVIQELVDRTFIGEAVILPFEGFDADVSSVLCCHQCKKPIVNVWSNIEYKPKFCHYCGNEIEYPA